MKGEPVGSGEFLLRDGRVYVGSMQNWELTGLGKLSNKDGSFY